MIASNCAPASPPTSTPHKHNWAHGHTDTQVFAVRAADPALSARLASLALLPDSSPIPSASGGGDDAAALAAADVAASLARALSDPRRPLVAEAARGLLALSAVTGAHVLSSAICRPSHTAWFLAAFCSHAAWRDGSAVYSTRIVPSLRIFLTALIPSCAPPS